MTSALRLSSDAFEEDATIPPRSKQSYPEWQGASASTCLAELDFLAAFLEES